MVAFSAENRVSYGMMKKEENVLVLPFPSLDQLEAKPSNHEQNTNGVHLWRGISNNSKEMSEQAPMAGLLMGII